MCFLKMVNSWKWRD